MLICWAALILIVWFVFHRLKRTDMDIPEGAERWLPPRSKQFAREAAEARRDAYGWPEDLPLGPVDRIVI